jgi:hypothetical protein
MTETPGRKRLIKRLIVEKKVAFFVKKYATSKK